MFSKIIFEIINTALSSVEKRTLVVVDKYNSIVYGNRNILCVQ